jgi:hypothetical protein
VKACKKTVKPFVCRKGERKRTRLRNTLVRCRKKALEAFSRVFKKGFSPRSLWFKNDRRLPPFRIDEPLRLLIVPMNGFKFLQRSSIQGSHGARFNADRFFPQCPPLEAQMTFLQSWICLGPELRSLVKTCFSTGESALVTSYASFLSHDHYAVFCSLGDSVYRACFCANGVSAVETRSEKTTKSWIGKFPLFDGRDFYPARRSRRNIMSILAGDDTRITPRTARLIKIETHLHSPPPKSFPH